MLSTKDIDKIHARRDANREVVTALRHAAQTLYMLDAREILALANRIEFCGMMLNTFIAKDATNFYTGELFDATGQLWECGSKLCSFCVAKFSRGNRKKLRDALSDQKLRPGEKYYFATFTIPNLNISIRESRLLADETWVLFRKRLLYVSSIRGGAKSEEFTVTVNGVHYHHHHLWIAKYLHFQELRRSWTECAEKVFRKNHYGDQWDAMINRRRESNRKWNEEHPELEQKTDLLLIAKFKIVQDLDSLVHELCKYITKSNSWNRLSQSVLVEAALTRRWWRMFELYGSFALRNRHDAVEEDDGLKIEPIVHTSILSDALPSHFSDSWRDVAIKMEPGDYRGFLFLEVDAAIRLRRDLLSNRWTFSTVITLAELLDEDFTDNTKLLGSADWLQEITALPTK